MTPTRERPGRAPGARLSRREILALGAGAAAFTGLGAGRVLANAGAIPGAGGAAPAAERSLDFINLHTGETLSAVYWAEGAYVGENLGRIDRILRDHRTNEVREIDRGLLDLLFALRTRLDARAAYHVISGYRSPRTNRMLYETGHAVDPNSFHMYGKAIDVRLSGRELSELQAAALALRAGGVGFYPKPAFVHLDVGPLRSW